MLHTWRDHVCTLPSFMSLQEPEDENLALKIVLPIVGCLIVIIIVVLVSVVVYNNKTTGSGKRKYNDLLRLIYTFY